VLPDATTVRFLPEQIDVSFLVTTAGLGALVATLFGALRGYDSERHRRVVLFGTVVGSTLGVAYPRARADPRDTLKLMVRFVLPYLGVGLALSGLAGWAYGGGDIGVLGSYGVLTLSIVIALIGYARWEQRQQGRRSPRR
jgi:hypothetical protein